VAVTGHIKKCINLGISKVNVGTEFKALYSLTLRESVNQLPVTEMEPRVYMAKIREACTRVVKKKINLFGSANRV
jgi:fructose/tagatose bisphosphate aldolase